MSAEVSFDDGKFYVKNYAYEQALLYYNIVDNLGNVLYDYKENISGNNILNSNDHYAVIYSNFDGIIIEGTIRKGKTYCYKIPITEDDLIYNGEYYTCEPVVIDTSKSYSVIVEENGKNNYKKVDFVGSVIVIDEENNIIKPLIIDGNPYFEFKPNVRYFIRDIAYTYEVFPSASDINSGSVSVIGITNN
jgi:hypothetical protein